jgi:mannose-6-phosphate isomerase-like protein (cupin superfamily)
MNENTKGMDAYKVGDSDTRPWGSYTVKAVGTKSDGEEFCEKEIKVGPGQVLSLQSHEWRREHWKVMAGTLTVLVDGTRRALAAGQDVRIPLRAIHCMANLGAEPCLVYELQEGKCREEDITRYMDAYGRAVAAATDEKTAASLTLYKALLAEIAGKQA